MIKSKDLENRQETGDRSEALQEAIKRGRRQLSERIAAARRLKAPRGSHCGCCYGRGRDDALRIIEEGGT